MITKSEIEKLNCFIDLHIHLDGSLSLETVKRLADMQNITLPSDAEVENMIHVSDGCRNLNEYLEKFDFPCSLLQTAEALRTAAFMLAEEMRAQGLIYAEVRFAPQKHCEKGLSQSDVVEAVLQGLAESALKTNLILCCMRGDDNHDENIETVRVAKQFAGKGVCAIDLAGAEALFPNEGFQDIFEMARSEGLQFTIHSGEALGPDSVKTALGYGAARIGHGVRSKEDPELLDRLAAEKIVLEMCPNSNLQTQVLDDLKDYPILEYLHAGIPVTVNTDNTSVSNTSIKNEWRCLVQALPIELSDFRTILENSARAAFLPESEREELIEKIRSALK